MVAPTSKVKEEIDVASERRSDTEDHTRDAVAVDVTGEVKGEAQAQEEG